MEHLMLKHKKGSASRGWIIKMACFGKCPFSKTLMVLLVPWGKNKKCAKFHDEKGFHHCGQQQTLKKILLDFDKFFCR